MKKRAVKDLPRLVVTTGDPAGIGPEVVAKALSRKEVFRLCRPVVVGDRRLYEPWGFPGELPVEFAHIPVGDLSLVRPGEVSVTAGRAAFEWILEAVRMIEAGEAEGMVTAPLSKAALNLAGVRYGGHTELLAALAKTKGCAMMMVAGGYRSVMVTRHVPLSRVGKKLSVSGIVGVARVAHTALQTDFGIDRPRIAVCALNPHAGEGGLLGREEGVVILPAVEALRAIGMDAAGPLPGDSAWMKAARGEFDLVVTMYHDQTMVPLKCLAPERIVNLTAGLPFVRTSPGHGTGFDIVGRDLADHRPMLEAVRVAASLCRERR